MTENCFINYRTYVNSYTIVNPLRHTLFYTLSYEAFNLFVIDNKQYNNVSEYILNQCKIVPELGFRSKTHNFLEYKTMLIKQITRAIIAMISYNYRLYNLIQRIDNDNIIYFSLDPILGIGYSTVDRIHANPVSNYGLNIYGVCLSYAVKYYSTNPIDLSMFYRLKIDTRSIIEVHKKFIVKDKTKGNVSNVVPVSNVSIVVHDIFKELDQDYTI